MVIRSTIITGNTLASGLRDIGGPEALAADVAFSLVGTSGASWPGFGNVAADPRFINPTSGNYRLRLNSPAIDAATDTPIAPFGLTGRIGDIADVDGDGITTTEALPYDIEPGQPREEEVSSVPNTGNNSSGTDPAISDMGCFEREAN